MRTKGNGCILELLNLAKLPNSEYKAIVSFTIQMLRWLFPPKHVQADTGMLSMACLRRVVDAEMTRRNNNEHRNHVLADFFKHVIFVTLGRAELHGRAVWTMLGYDLAPPQCMTIVVDVDLPKVASVLHLAKVAVCSISTDMVTCIAKVDDDLTALLMTSPVPSASTNLDGIALTCGNVRVTEDALCKYAQRWNHSALFDITAMSTLCMMETIADARARRMRCTHKFGGFGEALADWNATVSIADWIADGFVVQEGEMPWLSTAKDDCCICLEANSPVVVAECGHRMHPRCGAQYIATLPPTLNNSVRCPLCRQNLIVKTFQVVSEV